MYHARLVLVWATLAALIILPVWAAAHSPLLAWRDGIYIAAGFAGIAGLALLVIQPLLIGQYLPGIRPRQSRLWHRYAGTLLVVAVLLHVAGLWMTSPPDVIDALLFASPTPFSVWGVIAMWALFAAALVAALRARWRQRFHLWRALHSALAAIIVAGTVLHALLIEGSMELFSKWVLCASAAAATIWLLADKKPIGLRRPPHR